MKKTIAITLVFLAASLLYYGVFFSAIGLSSRRIFIITMFYSVCTLPVVFIDISTNFLVKKSKTSKRNYMIKYTLLFIITGVHIFLLQEIVANSFIKMIIEELYFSFIFKGILWSLFLVRLYQEVLINRHKL